MSFRDYIDSHIPADEPDDGEHDNDEPDFDGPGLFTAENHNEEMPF